MTSQTTSGLRKLTWTARITQTNTFSHPSVVLSLRRWVGGNNKERLMYMLFVHTVCTCCFMYILPSVVFHYSLQLSATRFKPFTHLHKPTFQCWTWATVPEAARCNFPSNLAGNGTYAKTTRAFFHIIMCAKFKSPKATLRDSRLNHWAMPAGGNERL